MDNFILGGGMTGLAAGFASGLPVFEAREQAGGICCSYYMRPGTSERIAERPADDEAYRFELGGGHWIFGGDPAIINFISRLVEIKTYNRKSSVFFPNTGNLVPYPIQNHLRLLDPQTRSSALVEMSQQPAAFQTMKEWLYQFFGPSLCQLFFDGFHQLYTAGLYDRIVPQDAYKSPIDLAAVIRGAFGDVEPVGYNTTFIYPVDGLDALARQIASGCDIRYNKRAVRIDPALRTIEFADNSKENYERLISTLPLNQMMEMTGLVVDSRADPHSSVLVLNIGAKRGPRCPDDHWLYVPMSVSGFHRVGFYSAVDGRFLPASGRSSPQRVSIYVERAYLPGDKPSSAEEAKYVAAVVNELQDFGFITETEVVDPTWIDVAYTWSWPQSKWRTAALHSLEKHGIFQVGRYGRWIFQGIADSIRDGFIVGSSFRRHDPRGVR